MLGAQDSPLLGGEEGFSPQGWVELGLLLRLAL